MSKHSASRRGLRVDGEGVGTVAHAGVVLLLKTARVVGLDRGLSASLGRWRRPAAVHDPGKIVLDLAVSLAAGGDCLADVNVLRAAPKVFGLVASDPTVSRLVAQLAGDAPRALAAISTARAAARSAAWHLAGDHAPDAGVDGRRPLVVDVDATLVTAHSDKEGAAPTFKRGYGHHPLWAFVDHGPAGTGEPLAVVLRPGNAGSNTAADHITVLGAALAQLPGTRARAGRRVLVRIDGAGATHDLLSWLDRRRLGYSVGFTLPATTGELLAQLPEAAWTPAYDSGGAPRDGAAVAELTGLIDLSGCPAGMRVVIRPERPHPGAQLRIVDVDGNQITAFATNTARGQLADLELRHRRRARCEDRIRLAKDTGLANLPLHSLDQNRIWCALVTLACELTAWTQLLAYPTHAARRWEPKRLRHRLLSIPGRLARHARRDRLHLPKTHPWTPLLLQGLQRLQGLTPT